MSERTARSATHAIVRVPLGWTLGPECAALLVREDQRPFALVGRWAGGGALIGSEPVRVASPDDDPFALLDQQPRVAHATGPAADAVAGGWFGYLGYELGRRLEPVGASPPITGGLPQFELAFYDHLLRLDDAGRWWFEALWSASRATALRERLRALKARAADRPPALPFSTEAWRATPGVCGHKLAIDACRTRIHAGDLFQANICHRLESRLRGAPVDLFVAAASELTPDRAAFLAGPWGAVASLSPELFLERHGRRVRSVPIKGTTRRSQEPRAAARERDALLASAKDLAENVMIVDLVRNDLGRVCVPGSIAVQALAQARPHVGVWHLISEVAGMLPDGVGDGRLVRAAFPPGSVTGAPKVAALNVIAELESTARNVYTGAIGFASPVAGLELSVAIRTFEFRSERAWVGVGGGIVADSDPLAEAAECGTKARPLLAAIGARLAPDDGHAAGPAPRRLRPRPVPRPDPAAGVFETLLVADGRPLALERHLARLARSVGALYRGSLAAGLAEELVAAAWQVGRARVRVDFRPGSGSFDIELTDLAERALPVRLIPRTLPGGLGAHKWIDRRPLAALGDEGEPLLCDLDGLVLEAGRANVFAVDESGRLLTPAADGRILPGVTRARVLELAPALGFEVSVQPIRLGELARCSELFVTGALGGVEPAHLDGGPPEPGAVTAQFAEALRGAGRASLTPA
jgi:para-aminobenzoate synthetase / 4-amino-4-deoxychorismate lyase